MKLGGEAAPLAEGAGRVVSRFSKNIEHFELGGIKFSHYFGAKGNRLTDEMYKELEGTVAGLARDHPDAAKHLGRVQLFDLPHRSPDLTTGLVPPELSSHMAAMVFGEGMPLAGRKRSGEVLDEINRRYPRLTARNLPKALRNIPEEMHGLLAAGSPRRRSQTRMVMNLGVILDEGVTGVIKDQHSLGETFTHEFGHVIHSQMYGPEQYLRGFGKDIDDRVLAGFGKGTKLGTAELGEQVSPYGAISMNELWAESFAKHRQGDRSAGITNAYETIMSRGERGETQAALNKNRTLAYAGGGAAGVGIVGAGAYARRRRTQKRTKAHASAGGHLMGRGS